MTTPAPRGIPGRWKAKFVDEFNGRLSPKFTAGWDGAPVAQSLVTVPMGDAGEIACYDPACVKVANGLCVIQTIRKQQSVGGREFEYATGLIATPEAVIAPGDAWEWHASMAYNHAGLWTSAPAWPKGGECDTAEVLYDGAANVATSNYHGPGPTDSRSGAIAGSWLTGWHTFATVYGEESVDTYWDGMRVATLATGGAKAEQWLIASMMLDQWAHQTVPARMVIDYVRVWEPAT